MENDEEDMCFICIDELLGKELNKETGEISGKVSHSIKKKRYEMT